MAYRSKNNQEDQEGLQVAVPDTAPEVVPAQPGVNYSTSTSLGKNKEAYRVDEYRSDGSGQEAQVVHDRPSK